MSTVNINYNVLLTHPQLCTSHINKHKRRIEDSYYVAVCGVFFFFEWILKMCLTCNGRLFNNL